MTREQAAQILNKYDINFGIHTGCEIVDAVDMAIKALHAWDKFKQALDKRILEQGFDEDEWSVSYNELIKMMKKCGGVEC